MVENPFPFMTPARRAVLVGALVYVGLKILLSSLLWRTIAWVADERTAMRLHPYTHYFLIDAIAQYQYYPWGDQVFLLRVIILSAGPVACAAWIAGRFGGWGPAAIVACAGVHFLLVMHWHVFSEPLPDAVRSCFLKELLAVSVCAALGAWRGSTHHQQPIRCFGRTVR